MKKYLPLFICIILVSVLFAKNRADANPSQFLVQKSAAATTTVSYMSAGTATTTNAFDTQGDGGLPTDSLALLINIVASSSPSGGAASTLNWKYEFCQENCDTSGSWFGENEYTNINATTTYASRLQKEYTWVTASSTIGSLTAPQSTTTKMVMVPTPTRWVRVVFYLPAGSKPLSVWSEFVGKKQK